MIRLIEALNFRCLQYISQPLGRFHVLVGPNASGKTTFLDVVAFLARLVSDGPEAAVRDRTRNFQDLVWGGAGERFELAIEAEIPADQRAKLSKGFDTIRYEVALGQSAETNGIGIIEEYVLLKRPAQASSEQRRLFPRHIEAPRTIIAHKKTTGTRCVLSKSPGGNDNFYSEVLEESGKGWFPSIKLGPKKSALGTLPPVESRFPASTWLKELLAERVQSLVLNSLFIRQASPPGQVRGFKPDGSNLPWVIEDLRRSKERFADWIAHLQTALPDLEDIQTIDREDDRHRYLLLCYRGGLKVPSWTASDGTLRLLALTLPAYLPDFRGIYLIEEPENGIHPRAIEPLFQSLSSAYDAQILVATHSPVILSAAQPEQVLCFKKTDEGASDIVSGREHPALQQWRRDIDLGSLFAAGVLG